MKKVRCSLILVLAALMLTVFVSCNEKIEEPSQYAYDIFAANWKKAEQNAQNMPKTPNYTEISSEELAAFNANAEKGTSARIEDDSFKIIIRGSGILTQDATGEWSFAPSDYSFKQFNANWKAAEYDPSKMTMDIDYNMMPDEGIEAFNKSASGAGIRATYVDGFFTVTLINDDVLTQNETGWTLEEVDYSYETFINNWNACKGDISKMPATPIYRKMDQADIEAFETACPASFTIQNKAFNYKISDLEYLTQDKSGKWSITDYSLKSLISAYNNMTAESPLSTDIKYFNMNAQAKEAFAAACEENGCELIEASENNRLIIVFPDGQMGIEKWTSWSFKDASYRQILSKYNKTKNLQDLPTDKIFANMNEEQLSVIKEFNMDGWYEVTVSPESFTVMIAADKKLSQNNATGEWEIIPVVPPAPGQEAKLIISKIWLGGSNTKFIGIKNIGKSATATDAYTLVARDEIALKGYSIAPGETLYIRHSGGNYSNFPELQKIFKEGKGKTYDITVGGKGKHDEVILKKGDTVIDSFETTDKDDNTINTVTRNDVYLRDDVSLGWTKKTTADFADMDA